MSYDVIARRGELVANLGTRIVRIVYSDESGTGSKKDEPIVVVAAVMMNMDQHWTKMESELRTILARTPDILLGEYRELKGKILYSAVRKNVRLAGDILTRILAILVTNPTEIFYGAMDRVGYDSYVAKHHQDTTSAKLATSVDAAFDACLARIHNYARASLPKEQILWIADHGDKEREQSAKTGHNWAKSLNFRGWDLVTLTRKHSHSSEPLRIADSIYFGHSHESLALQMSHESLALQMADICCSTITLQLLETLYGWRPCAGPFYEIIRFQVINDGTPPMHMLKGQLGKGANGVKRKV